jgi:hypothetical protein
MPIGGTQLDLPPVIVARGTQLKLADPASPAVYAPVGGVRSITGPTSKPKLIDITTHDVGTVDFFTQEVEYWSRRLPVLMDGGDISFEINYNNGDATHAFKTGLWNSMVKFHYVSMQMIWPVNVDTGAYHTGVMYFTGYIMSHEMSFPVDNVITARINMAISDNVVAVNNFNP